MITLDKVYKLLPPVQNKRVLTKESQSTKDIIEQVLEQHKQNVKDAKKIAHLFDAGNAYGTCSNIWDFLKYKVPYKVEPSEKQTTKTLSRIIYDAKRGAGNDCKHYSGFTGAILDALGYKFKYRFAGYSDYINTPTHVYCICTQNGNTIYVDAVINGFDVEKPYKLKIDKEMSLYKLSGLEDTQQIGGFWDWAKKTVDNGFAYVNKNVPVLKKVADVAGDVAQKVKDFALTSSLMIPRNAFLLLLRFNVRGWATGLKNKTYNDLEWWAKYFGGERPKLMETIKLGAKEARILGINDNDMLFPSQVGFIGEPLTIAGALAAAVPIISKVESILDKAQKVADKGQNLYNKAENVANKGQNLFNKAASTADIVNEASKNFEKTTGINPKDVIWKKDAGKTGDKNGISKDDFKPVDDATAKQVALAVTQKRGEQTGIIPKIDNKMLLIGGGLALAGIYFATKKR
jgi:hypothetical protein